MKKPALYIPLAVFLLMAVLLGAGFWLEDPHKLPSELIGRPMPEFALVDVNDPQRTVRKEDLLGHISLLNVWATWCPSCKVEHPQLLAIAKEGQVRVIGINYNDEIAKAQRWLKQYEDPYWVTVSDSQGTLGIDLGVYGAPETFILDHKGFIRYRYVGPITRHVWLTDLLPRINEIKQEQPEQAAQRG